MSTNFFCPRCRERITTQGGSHATCPGCGLVIDLALADTNAGAPSFVPIRDLSGETVGHYQLHECLGSGGMGAVYRATDTRVQAEVAVKLLSPAFLGQPDLIERFHREAQALAGLNHINIVGFHEEGQAAGQHYIAMEYVAGENLETYLARETPTPERALEIVTAIAEALRVAHEQGVIHRDLKPANVIVTGDNVKVLDFGIAHIALEDLTLTHSNAILGTVNYMAPEQRTHAKEVDHRADIFSLGVLFYRMLTGTLPIGSFEQPSRLSSAVPRTFDRLVERMLHRDPDRRHADAEKLLADLHALDRPPSKVARVSAWSAAASVAAVTGVMVLLNVNAADDVEPALDQGEQAVAKDAAVAQSNLPPEPAEPTDDAGEEETEQPARQAQWRTSELKNAKGVTQVETNTGLGTTSGRGTAKEVKRGRKKKRAPKSTGKVAGIIREKQPATTKPTEKADTGKQSYVGTRGSVLYVSSTAESDLIRPLKPGEEITVLKVRRGKDKQQWAAVRTDRGEIGYVRSTSLQAKPPPPSSSKKGGKKAAKGSYPSVGKGNQAMDLRDSGSTAPQGSLSTTTPD